MPAGRQEIQRRLPDVLMLASLHGRRRGPRCLMAGLCLWLLVILTLLSSWFHPVICMHPPCPLVRAPLSFLLHAQPEPGCSLLCEPMWGSYEIALLRARGLSLLGPLRGRQCHSSLRRISSCINHNYQVMNCTPSISDLWIECMWVILGLPPLHTTDRGRACMFACTGMGFMPQGLCSQGREGVFLSLDGWVGETDRPQRALVT